MSNQETQRTFSSEQANAMYAALQSVDKILGDMWLGNLHLYAQREISKVWKDTNALLQALDTQQATEPARPPATGSYKDARGVLAGLGDEPAEVSIRRLRDAEDTGLRYKIEPYGNSYLIAKYDADGHHDGYLVERQNRSSLWTYDKFMATIYTVAEAQQAAAALNAGAEAGGA